MRVSGDSGRLRSAGIFFPVTSGCNVRGLGQPEPIAIVTGNRRAGATCGGDPFASGAENVALEESDSQPSVDDPGFGSNHASRHRANEADFQIDRGKIFPWEKRPAESDSHCRVGQGGNQAAMDASHGIVVLAVATQGNHRVSLRQFSLANRVGIVVGNFEANQSGDWRFCEAIFVRKGQTRALLGNRLG
jgi:hypothetical protein